MTGIREPAPDPVPQARDGAAPRITLLGKPGCHLCETAREVVSTVADELGIAWQELSILDDPDLYERYWEQIPVILVDGRPHEYWRVDERRLRQALSGPPGSSGSTGAPGSPDSTGSAGAGTPRRGWFRRRRER